MVIMHEVSSCCWGVLTSCSSKSTGTANSSAVLCHLQTAGFPGEEDVNTADVLQTSSDD